MQETGLEKIRNFGMAMFEYDFAKDGGAIGDIVLDNDVIPDDAIIMDGIIEVKTALAGATATIAFKVNSAGDIKAATAVASFSAGALLDVVPVGTAATMIKTAAKKNLTMTIATAALTAGKLGVYLRYVVGI